MNRLGLASVIALQLLGTSFAKQEAAALPVKAKLERTFKAGESQAYTIAFAMTPKAMPSELKGSAEFTLTAQSLLEGGGANVEMEYKSIKMSFGGQEVPADDLPGKRTFAVDKFGMEKALDAAETEDPFSWLTPAFCLPGLEAEVGKPFQLKWASDGDKVKISGEGKLIATGMLYEEHVSKVAITANIEAKDESPAKFEYTAYFNTENGKLVKAEGSITSSQAELGGDFTATFTIAKVRSK